jgi:hypothetical protein
LGVLRDLWSRRQRRSRRLLALLAFRDEMRFLPGLFENLEGHVEGVVALDDQSVDGSREFVQAQPSVLELLTVEPGAQAELEDGKNHRALTQAAWAHGADWLLGIDADERVERDFRSRAEFEIDKAEQQGHDALWVHFRELWDSPDRVRMDGIWGMKRKACLFRSDPRHRFDLRRVHAIWASYPPSKGDWPQADLTIYHLRMIRPDDRRRRVERYRRIDPENRWQTLGYDYLLETQDLELRQLERGRDYLPVGR